MSSSGSKAGAINEEGGTFGKLEVAREAEYFYKKVFFFWQTKRCRSSSFQFQQLEQLSAIKHKTDVSAEDMLKKQIKEHEEALIKAKDNLNKLKKWTRP